MSQDHLGLFDTPPTQKEVRLSLALVGLLLAVALLILPVRDVRLLELDAFIPTVDAVMFVGDGMTAALLYAQAFIFRSRALTVLATGYVLSALLLIPHALTFPGAFSADGLLHAGVNTTGWLAYFRRATFPVVITLYVFLRNRDAAGQSESKRSAPKISISLFVAAILAALLTLLATRGHALLPPFYVNRSDVIYSNAVQIELGMFAVFVIAMALLFRARASVLDMWLLVAFWALLVQSMLVMTLHGRFTAGWYLMYGLFVFSHLVVLLALITESSRLYVRLALSTSAHSRERERRLMSLNAMAGTLFQEVGQPLSAMITSASVTKSWLSRSRPDHERAIESLHDTIAAGERTFDVIKNVRAKFSGRSEVATEFSLNILLREIALEMDTELAAKNAVLQLDLAETLPSVRADRVQVCRVLLYLVAVVLDSQRDRRGRPTRVTVRTRPSEGRHVLLEISVANVAAAARDMEQTFEPVVMSKDCDLAQALSLCHTIIEDQGGYLSAAYDGDQAIGFRVRLPRA